MEINYYFEGTKRTEPIWYLYCNDKKELKDEIQNEILTDIDTGYVTLKQSELNFDLPEEFVKEWRELKRLRNQK